MLLFIGHLTHTHTHLYPPHSLSAQETRWWYQISWNPWSRQECSHSAKKFVKRCPTMSSSPAPFPMRRSRTLSRKWNKTLTILCARTPQLASLPPCSIGQRSLSLTFLWLSLSLPFSLSFANCSFNLSFINFILTSFFIPLWISKFPST